jgi:dipeptidyl aminopeptidase/acylaminoacyl peptidase
VTQVWRADISGRARALTSLKTDALSLEWAAGGSRLLIGTRPALQAGEAAIDREGRDGYHFDARFWALSEARPRPRLPLPETILLLDTGSGRLRAATPEEADLLRRPAPDRPAGSALFVAAASGNRAWTAPDDPRLLFAPARLHVSVRQGEIACPEAICARRVAGIWWRRPDELLILRGGGPEDGGQLQLYSWRPGVEAAPRLRLATDRALTGCTLWRDALLCAREAAAEPRRLVAIDPDSGAETLVFDPNPEAARLALGTVRRLGWSNRQGMRTYGDLVLPPSHRPGQRYPLIVVQYISRGFLRGGTGDEYPIFLLAQHGFAVLSFQRPAALPATERAADINALQRINIEDWAERRMIVSALDAGIDAAIATGAIDPGRLGITGMSDGATTTQFALNTLKRFQAAAISTCCDEPSGLFSVGPAYRDAVLAWGYPRQGEGGGAFWKPMSLAANASTLRTPLLIQIPDAEYRWSLETVSALAQHGGAVDMYVFPDENHVKAHPAHRAAIYRRSVGWFEFWLRGSTDLPGLEGEAARWGAMRQVISRN